VGVFGKLGVVNLVVQKKVPPQLPRGGQGHWGGGGPPPGEKHHTTKKKGKQTNPEIEKKQICLVF